MMHFSTTGPEIITKTLFFLFIFPSRRGLCCADDGLLLLAFSKDLKSLSDYLMPQSKKEVNFFTLFLPTNLKQFLSIRASALVSICSNQKIRGR